VAEVAPGSAGTPVIGGAPAAPPRQSGPLIEVMALTKRYGSVTAVDSLS
jgi:hypothetical protein